MKCVVSSGRAVGYHVRGPRFESQSGQSQFFIAPLSPPISKGWLDLLRPGESKGGEESNGKLPHNGVCQGQSGPSSRFPNAWTLFTFLLLVCELCK
ncbi:hypothetical protein PoB_007589500 [Plakobranchus ocellatus]|uniref:Uncharacterized protein n=1 Tax=Plakobranchus ocellatus TaxID=259542 RepID=A0AAV4DYX0_9GAST|nr:hypothetical protein PoB_007589500 [Plakobranchus ocellatus]